MRVFYSCCLNVRVQNRLLLYANDNGGWIKENDGWTFTMTPFPLFTFTEKRLCLVLTIGAFTCLDFHIPRIVLYSVQRHNMFPARKEKL
uniref:Uncharacterized protein n=1 Tax=Solanum lycopersicum TaxID=4081 RepID=A0A3Q7GWJ1_SOLLC